MPGVDDGILGSEGGGKNLVSNTSGQINHQKRKREGLETKPSQSKLRPSRTGGTMGGIANEEKKNSGGGAGKRAGVRFRQGALEEEYRKRVDRWAKEHAFKVSSG